MNGFGEQTVAAITTAYRVDTIILLPIINLGSGIATVAAQNIGAGKPERVRRILRTGLVVMSVVSVILTLIVFLFGAWLISIFGLTPSTVDIGRSFFTAIASFYIVFGLAMALRGYVEGHGDMLFSGLAGIAFWINDYYKLPEEHKVDKHDALVVAMKERIDAEYEEGRNSSFGDDELVNLIYSIDSHRIRELEAYSL